MTYSSPATRYSCICIGDGLEVLILAFLYKGDASGFITNNATIKL